jgi:hypothetical protein
MASQKLWNLRHCRGRHRLSHDIVDRRTVTPHASTWLGIDGAISREVPKEPAVGDEDPHVEGRRPASAPVGPAGRAGFLFEAPEPPVGGVASEASSATTGQGRLLTSSG